jgi:glutathione S-transferase
MDPYRLFWFPGTCARVACAAFEELDVAYEITLVEKFSGPPKDYLELNPKGKVPLVITPEGVSITENPAIQFHLARTHPEAGLLPSRDAAREIEVLELLGWFTAGVHPLITRARFPRFFCTLEAAWDDIRGIALAQLEDCFAIVEDRLGDRDWLFEDWSLVDVHLSWLWFRASGSGLTASRYSRCQAHNERVESWPSVARALDREELALARLSAEGRIPAWVPVAT